MSRHAQPKVILYGIKNCDTVKKARKWLDGRNVAYQFHDFRVDGVDKKLFAAWLKELGSEKLINKRGTTWRNLSDNVKRNLTDATALSLMLESPTVIKRPVWDIANQYYVGFDMAKLETLLN